MVILSARPITVLDPTDRVSPRHAAPVADTAEPAMELPATVKAPKARMSPITVREVSGPTFAIPCTLTPLANTGEPLTDKLPKAPIPATARSDPIPTGPVTVMASIARIHPVSVASASRAGPATLSVAPNAKSPDIDTRPDPTIPAAVDKGPPILHDEPIETASPNTDGDITDSDPSIRACPATENDEPPRVVLPLTSRSCPTDASPFSSADVADMPSSTHSDPSMRTDSWTDRGPVAYTGPLSNAFAFVSMLPATLHVEPIATAPVSEVPPDTWHAPVTDRLAPRFAFCCTISTDPTRTTALVDTEPPTCMSAPTLVGPVSLHIGDVTVRLSDPMIRPVTTESLVIDPSTERLDPICARDATDNALPITAFPVTLNPETEVTHSGPPTDSRSLSHTEPLTATSSSTCIHPVDENVPDTAVSERMLTVPSIAASPPMLS